MSTPCVVLIASGRVYDTGVEDALAELSRLGHPVWRVRTTDPAPDTRDRMTAEALAAGFTELLFVDPAVLFTPADVERLRAHNLPLVCSLYPLIAARSFACEFLPDTTTVRFGRTGAPTEIAACALGFALARRSVFDALRQTLTPTPDGLVPYFTPPAEPPAPGPVPAADAAFCARVRACGLPVVADTSIRLWHIGPHRYGWEDITGDRERHDAFTLHLAPAPDTDNPTAHPEPHRNPLRGPARPLPGDFPRLRAFVPTYPANADSLARTLASIRASDWGEEPIVVTQPADWPVGRASGTANYKRALEAAAADGCDFALVLEDDVHVGRHLRHNLLANPLVARDQCDYLGLFIPDLIADPWERTEPHLGYRLAKPRYTGPNALWPKYRMWGSQAYLLSRRLVLAALERWDRLSEVQDARVLGTCAELGLPLWYTAPCLVEHAPFRTAFETPDTFAPDFDPNFRLTIRSGFQPPEDVPGWLTLGEGALLWRTVVGRDVLELGTASGRSTVCLAQSARWVVSVDVADQSEAAEWVRRFGCADRVEFRRGDAADMCGALSGPFGLIFIDTLHDAASVARDIAAALPLLAPGGLLAFHDYPDLGWPDVRRVVDEHARRLGWKRVEQADYLGVFRT